MNGKVRKRRWNEAAGRALYDLIYPRWSAEKVADFVAADGATIDAKTIRGWFWLEKRGHCPHPDTLAKVCKAIGTTPANFEPYLNGRRYPPVQHPHGGISRELRREVEEGNAHVVQLLAPPGSLKTQVLRELEDELKKKECPCLYISASSVGNAVEFWRTVAHKLQDLNIPVMSPRGDDYYFVVEEGLRDRGCVLLVDGADSWLVTTRASRVDARTWLARLVDVPCLVVISGIIDLTHLSLITGGQESDSIPLTVSSAWNDTWDDWATAVCEEAGIADPAAKSQLESWAQRHPGAYIEGVRALQRGDGAKEKVREYHRGTAERILRKISPQLGPLLIGDGLESLGLDTVEAKVLLRAGILHQRKSKLLPAVREWGELWREKGLAT